MCLFIKSSSTDPAVLGAGGKSSKGAALALSAVSYKIGSLGPTLRCITDAVDFESGDEGGDTGGEGGGFGRCISKPLLFCAVMFMSEFMSSKGAGPGGDRR